MRHSYHYMVNAYRYEEVPEVHNPPYYHIHFNVVFTPPQMRFFTFLYHLFIFCNLPLFHADSYIIGSFIEPIKNFIGFCKYGAKYHNVINPLIPNL